MSMVASTQTCFIRIEAKLMSNVYIINDSGHNFSSANKFGKLVPLSSGKINKFHVMDMLRDFDEVLCKSHKNDYILQNGPAIMSMVASAIFASYHGCLNLLIWRIDEGKETYVVRRMKLKRKK